MKKKFCFTLTLIICIALAGGAKKYRPTGLKNVVFRDGDMEYYMQGLVIDVPVPKNHNNDYLFDDVSNRMNIPQTESKIVYYPTFYVRNKLLNDETPIDLDEIIYNNKHFNVDRPAFDDCYIWDVAIYDEFIFFIAKTCRQWFTLFFDTKTYDTDCISQSLMRKGLSSDKMWIITYNSGDMSNTDEFSRESLGELYDFIKNARERENVNYQPQ